MSALESFFNTIGQIETSRSQVKVRFRHSGPKAAGRLTASFDHSASRPMYVIRSCDRLLRKQLSLHLSQGDYPALLILGAGGGALCPKADARYLAQAGGAFRTSPPTLVPRRHDPLQCLRV